MKNLVMSSIKQVFFLVAMLTIFTAHSSYSASCDYTVISEWDSGFVVNLQIKNDTDTAINGWSVTLSYAGSERLVNGWGAEYFGEQSVTALNLIWNEEILPGAYVEIGFVGSKNNALAQTPTLGGICSELSHVENQIELDTNKRLWERKEIKDYQYTFAKECFFVCQLNEDIVVNVIGDKVNSAYYTPSGVLLSDDALLYVYTVDDLFEEVQSAITNNVDVLNVQYDPLYGLPKIISVDVSKQLIDEEYVLSALDFSLLSNQTILDAYRAQWAEFDIRNYQYTYSLWCFYCVVEDIVINVLDAQVESAYLTPDGTILGEDRLPYLNTIDDLFDVVQRYIDSGASVVDVTYDEVSGLPVYIKIDRSDLIYDDELFYSATDFFPAEL